MLGETIGSIIFTNSTSSGYLITSTNKTLGITTTPQTRIFHIHLVSTSTASNITIQNGQGGTTYINVIGKIDKGIDFDFGWWGIVFPFGAFVTYDGNQLEGVITCKGETNDIGEGIVNVIPPPVGMGILDNSGNLILDDSGNIIVDDSGN